MAISTSWTLPDLYEHLQAAVELELLVIPPYLCALYSLHPGTNAEAALIIRSVVVEEMLHMILAANVLNAIGRTPTVADPAWVPRYPARIPHHTHDFQVGLLPFGDEALEVFLAIENPSHSVATLEAWPPDEAAIPRAMELSRTRQYATIGEFYKAIQQGLCQLDADIDHDLFIGDLARQIGPEHYYASGGRAIVVHDLDTALEALEQIIDQGEGDVTMPRLDEKFDEEGDLAHYYRFNELRYRRRYLVDDAPAEPTGAAIEIDLDAVYPMQPNLRVDQLPTEALREAANAFNIIYVRLLRQVETAFDGCPDALMRAVGTMFELKDSAIDLLRIPLPGTSAHAGPTFEYPY